MVAKKRRSKATEIKELAAAFAKLGAENPVQWAESQVEEGIPQLAIFCFCKALWECVLKEDDEAWVDRQAADAAKHPRNEFAQIGLAMKEMLAKGVSRRTIVDLVRGIQAMAIVDVSCLLDGTREFDLPVNQWDPVADRRGRKPDRRHPGDARSAAQPRPHRPRHAPPQTRVIG